MKRFSFIDMAVVVFFLTLPFIVWANPGPFGPFDEVSIKIHGDKENIYATVTLANNQFSAVGENIITFDTPEGEVVLLHRVTRNTDYIGGCCDDRLTVQSKPDSLVAIPSEIIIAENENGVINLYLFKGM